MTQANHGGGVDRAMMDLGLSRAQIFDFSASINPLGPPAEVQQALVEALPRISDYPEIDAASLRQQLALFHALPEENLLPASGSMELISLLPRVLKPRRALLLQPCFGEYAPALRQVGCQIDYLPLSAEEDFSFINQRLLEALSPETDLLVLANPGNPTGALIPPRQLLELAGQLGSCKLLVDEAFIDFCQDSSVLPQVIDYDNLLVLRSLTKFYAIPGLRAGYLAGSRQLVARLAASRDPWSLSNLAIAAAQACLQADAFRRTTLEMIPLWRAELAEGLQKLGCQVWPGAANYLLCRLPPGAPSATELAVLLRRQGLLIRSCDDFTPLDEPYLRLAVLSPQSNSRLLKALVTLLGTPSGS